MSGSLTVPTDLVGTTAGPIVHRVDERWLMAYAACLGDTRPQFIDTTASTPLRAHPVFIVCPEWPVIVASRQATIDAGVHPDVVRTSIHATHDTTLHRPIRPGDELTTSLEVVGLVDKAPGALATTRLRTVDAKGSPVATTTQGGIYLGHRLEGADQPDPDAPTPLTVEPTGEVIETRVTLDAGAAHTYTECARIWNPIHTDRQVALAAGLPDIILHGTANLAHGVSAVLDRHAPDRPDSVRRISCRFSAMVQLPSTITTRVWDAVPTDSGAQVVPFEVLNEDGQTAVSNGMVMIEPA